MADLAAEEQTPPSGVAGLAGANEQASKYVVHEGAATDTVTEQVDIEDEGNVGDDESEERVEEPTFSCDRCEYITKTKTFLFVHREFEHEIRECDLCDGFSADTQAELVAHKEGEHGVTEWFECDDEEGCDMEYKAASKLQLKRHRKRVHNAPVSDDEEVQQLKEAKALAKTDTGNASGGDSGSGTSGSDYTTDSEEERERDKQRAKEKRKKKKEKLTGQNFLNRVRNTKPEISSSSSSSSEEEVIEYYDEEVENMMDLTKALEVNIIGGDSDESSEESKIKGVKRTVIKEACGSLRIHTTQVREDILNAQAELAVELVEVENELLEYESNTYLKYYYESIAKLKAKVAHIKERQEYETHRMVVYSQGDEGATAIGEGLLKNKYLKRLRLINSEIGPKGCIAMAPALKRHRRLEHFGLKFNDIKPEGVTAICKAFRNNRRGGVRELDLYGCKLGPEGATALAEQLRGNTYLEVLRLRFNNIGEEGGTAMAEMLKENQALVHVDLECNGLNMPGVVALAHALKTNKTVNNIFVANNGIERELRRPENDAAARLLFSGRLTGVWEHFSEFFKPHIV